MRGRLYFKCEKQLGFAATRPQAGCAKAAPASKPPISLRCARTLTRLPRHRGLCNELNYCTGSEQGPVQEAACAAPAGLDVVPVGVLKATRAAKEGSLGQTPEGCRRPRPHRREGTRGSHSRPPTGTNTRCSPCPAGPRPPGRPDVGGTVCTGSSRPGKGRACGGPSGADLGCARA